MEDSLYGYPGAEKYWFVLENKALKCSQVTKIRV
tara:strand:+ start:1069 stop:1170 length:102 start_codon:yes stop_codon:yes gene_type:complete